MPEIELRDVGTGSDKGILLAELTNILIQALLRAVADNAGSILPGDIGAELNKSLAQLESLGASAQMMVGDVTAMIGGAAKQVAEDAAKAGKELTKGLKEKGEKAGEEITEGISEGLGGLLGGEKKKDKGKTDKDE